MFIRMRRYVRAAILFMGLLSIAAALLLSASAPAVAQGGTQTGARDANGVMSSEDAAEARAAPRSTPGLAPGLLDWGFDCDFSDPSCEEYWEEHVGTWLIGRGIYWTEGVPNMSASTSYRAVYSCLEYEVRMRRFGESYANRIIVRGVPEPFGDETNNWHSGYYFQYTTDGSFSVWKFYPGATLRSRAGRTTARSTPVRSGTPCVC